MGHPCLSKLLRCGHPMAVVAFICSQLLSPTQSIRLGQTNIIHVYFRQIWPLLWTRGLIRCFWFMGKVFVMLICFKAQKNVPHYRQMPSILLCQTIFSNSNSGVIYYAKYFFVFPDDYFQPCDCYFKSSLLQQTIQQQIMIVTDYMLHQSSYFSKIQKIYYYYYYYY